MINRFLVFMPLLVIVTGIGALFGIIGAPVASAASEWDNHYLKSPFSPQSKVGATDYVGYNCTPEDLTLSEIIALTNTESNFYHGDYAAGKPLIDEAIANGSITITQVQMVAGSGYHYYPVVTFSPSKATIAFANNESMGPGLYMDMPTQGYTFSVYNKVLYSGNGGCELTLVGGTTQAPATIDAPWRYTRLGYGTTVIDPSNSSGSGTHINHVLSTNFFYSEPSGYEGGTITVGDNSDSSTDLPNAFDIFEQCDVVDVVCHTRNIATFFTNIPELTAALFIPSVDSLGENFSELKDFFTDKLGFLIFPIEFIVRVFTAMMPVNGYISDISCVYNNGQYGVPALCFLHVGPILGETLRIDWGFAENNFPAFFDLARTALGGLISLSLIFGLHRKYMGIIKS